MELVRGPLLVEWDPEDYLFKVSEEVGEEGRVMTRMRKGRWWKEQHQAFVG
jgi:hypothetical protein